jgi:molybdate transport system substrate-binding protein
MKLEILSAGAAKGVVLALQAQFLASSGAAINGSFGAVGSIREKFDAGEPCDVLILTAKMLAELEQAGRVVAGSIAALGQVQTGVAVRRGAALPDIADRAALSASLSNAKEIYVPDPLRSTAGIHFVSVLKKLGIHGEIEHNLRPYPNGAVAMAQLAQSAEPHALGCTQVTEILYTEGVTLVGLLPKEFELSTVYAAALSSTARNPELARAFIALLTGSQTQALRAEGGFDI